MIMDKEKRCFYGFQADRPISFCDRPISFFSGRSRGTNGPIRLLGCAECIILMFNV